MPQYTITRPIDAPPETVFKLLSDFENAPKRIHGIKRVEMLTEGPVGRGTRFKETRIVFKKEATEEMEILEFEPPRRYLIGAESCGCRYRTEFRVEPEQRGARVHMTFDAKPLTLAAKVMGFLMGPMFKMCMNQCAKDLDDVKAAAESNGASAEPDAPLGRACGIAEKTT